MLIVIVLYIHGVSVIEAGLTQSQTTEGFPARANRPFFQSLLSNVQHRTYDKDTGVPKRGTHKGKTSQEVKNRRKRKQDISIRVMGGIGSGRTPGSGRKGGGLSSNSSRISTPPTGQSSLRFEKTTNRFNLLSQSTSTSINSIPGLNKVKKVNNAPQAKAMDPVVKKADTSSTKTYKMKLLYVSKVRGQQTDVTEKLKYFMA